MHPEGMCISFLLDVKDIWTIGALERHSLVCSRMHALYVEVDIVPRAKGLSAIVARIRPQLLVDRLYVHLEMFLGCGHFPTLITNMRHSTVSALLVKLQRQFVRVDSAAIIARMITRMFMAPLDVHVQCLPVEEGVWTGMTLKLFLLLVHRRYVFVEIRSCSKAFGADLALVLLRMDLGDVAAQVVGSLEASLTMWAHEWLQALIKTPRVIGIAICR